MFNLDQQIDAWCREVVVQNCAGRAHLDELKDHLYCLVEAGQANGLDEQEAFVAALKQMGDHQNISSEYAKNTNLLQKIAAFDRRLPGRLQDRFTARQRSWLMLGNSIVCAAVILLGSLLYPAQQHPITLWSIALWLIPFSALAASSASTECRMLKRVLTFNRK